jgi:hypothetical protein
MTEGFPVKEEILKKYEYAVSAKLSANFLQSLLRPDIDVKTSPLVEYFADDVYQRVILTFWGRDEGCIEFNWYSSWWQELREKIFPHWYLERFPSKREIKMKRRIFATYPSLNRADKTHRVHLSCLEGDEILKSIDSQFKIIFCYDMRQIADRLLFKIQSAFFEQRLKEEEGGITFFVAGVRFTVALMEIVEEGMTQRIILRSLK